MTPWAPSVGPGSSWDGLTMEALHNACGGDEARHALDPQLEHAQFTPSEAH